MAADDPGNRISDIEGEQEVLPRRERGPRFSARFRESQY